MTKLGLQDLRALLLRLSSILQIPARSLAASEKWDELLYRDDQIPTSIVMSLSLSDFLDLVTAYESALSMQFRLDRLTIMTVNQSINADSLEKFHSDIQYSPTLVLEIKIDKNRVLELQRTNHARCEVRFYFFWAAFAASVQESLGNLDKGPISLPSNGRKLIVLVLDYDHIFDGEYLAILGRHAIANWISYVPSSSPDSELPKFISNQAKSRLSWSNFELDSLTPLHLMVTPVGVMTTSAVSDPVVVALAEKIVALSIIYVAESVSAPQSSKRDSAWEAHFTDGKVHVRVNFGTTAELQQALGVDDVRLLEVANKMGELARWVYLGERNQKLDGSDRLYVLQGIAARMLESDQPSVNYRTLVRKVSFLKRELTQAWYTFTSKKLDVFFSHRHDLEQDTVKKINDEIQVLIKGLTDNMLAAVGIVLGTFIAAVFANNFNATIFRLGLSVYAVYLLVFPGIIGLVSARSRFQNAKKDFDAQRAEYEAAIPSLVVDDIIGDSVKRREKSFMRWWWVTMIMFGLVAILLIAGGIVMPFWIATSTPTATPQSVSGTPTGTAVSPTQLTPTPIAQTPTP